jgi:hypothetical protein
MWLLVGVGLDKHRQPCLHIPDICGVILSCAVLCCAALCCRWGLFGGIVNAALTTYITRGKEPWTLKHRSALGLSSGTLRQFLHA